MPSPYHSRTVVIIKMFLNSFEALKHFIEKFPKVEGIIQYWLGSKTSKALAESIDPS